MTRTELVAAVRAWLKAYSAASALTDYQVWVADTNATRPRPPYLSVRVMSFGERFGTDGTEDYDDAGTPKRRPIGQRSAVVTVEAFGDTAAGWLEQADAALQLPEVAASTGDAGASIMAEGPLQNLTALRDTEAEPRYSQDFRVMYGYRGLGRTVVVAEQAAITATYTGATDLDSAFTVSLESE